MTRPVVSRPRHPGGPRDRRADRPLDQHRDHLAPVVHAARASSARSRPRRPPRGPPRPRPLPRAARRSGPARRPTRRRAGRPPRRPPPVRRRIGRFRQATPSRPPRPSRSRRRGAPARRSSFPSAAQRRELDAGDHLAGCERRREVRDEQVRRGDRPLAPRAEHARRGAVRDGAPRRARRSPPRAPAMPPIVPRWRTRTLPMCPAASASIGHVVAHRVGPLEVDVARQRREHERAVAPSIVRSPAPPTSTSSVGCRQSQHHHRDEALAAGDHVRVLAALARAARRRPPTSPRARSRTERRTRRATRRRRTPSRDPAPPRAPPGCSSPPGARAPGRSPRGRRTRGSSCRRRTAGRSRCRRSISAANSPIRSGSTSAIAKFSVIPRPRMPTTSTRRPRGSRGSSRSGLSTYGVTTPTRRAPRRARSPTAPTRPR